MAKARDHEPYLGFPYGCRGSKDLGHLPLFSQGSSMELRQQVEELGHKLVPMWNAGIVGSASASPSRLLFNLTILSGP